MPRAVVSSNGRRYAYDGRIPTSLWPRVGRATSHNNQLPPALSAFAPGNTARVASRVGNFERYRKGVFGFDIGAARIPGQ